jgi:hypothetical protein
VEGLVEEVGEVLVEVLLEAQEVNVFVQTADIGKCIKLEFHVIQKIVQNAELL